MPLLAFCCQGQIQEGFSNPRWPYVNCSRPHCICCFAFQEEKILGDMRLLVARNVGTGEDEEPVPVKQWNAIA